jgi:hypothetical protein
LNACGEFTVRISPFASLFAASLIALAPMHALAQEPSQSASVRDRPRPEYDPLGMRFGGFDLNASLDLGLESTNNVLASDTNEQDDIIYHVAPEARLSSHWSRHALSIAAGVDSQSYDDTSDADVTTGFVRANGRLDVGTDTDINLTGGWQHDAEPFTNPDAVPGQERVEYDHSDLAVTAGHTFNRVRIAATAATTSYDFEDANGVDQDRRDFDEQSFTGRIEYAVSPRLFIVGQATTDNRDFDNDPGNSSDGQTYLAGVRLNLTDLMVGEVTAGAFKRDYDGPAGDVDGTAVAANLEWYITQLTTLTFDASRNVQDGGASTSDPYVASTYGVRADHELLRNVLLNGAVRWGNLEYENIDREDKTFYGELGVTYLMNRRVALSAQYRHEENNSSGTAAYRDYDVDAVFAGVSLRL